MFPSNPLFAEALSLIADELAIQYTWIDEHEFLMPRRVIFLHRVFYHLSGRRPLGYWRLNRRFREIVHAFKPDVILATSGKNLSPASLRWVKEKTGALLVNYATDDPFNEAVTTSMFRQAIPLYDLYVCTKRAIIDDVRKAGCPNAMYLPFAYKPEVHFPEGPNTPDEKRRFTSDVVFIGECDEDRLPYITAMLKAIPDLRLHLYGGKWDRHPALRKYHRGFAIGHNFRLAVSGAKIIFNLVRKANRDDHVMRTFEIPACGGFMLADRTDGQRAFLTEDREAVYFSSVEEMIDKTRYYLDHPSERKRIAEAGRHRITSDKNTYKDRLRTIIELVGGRAGVTDSSSSAAPVQAG